jgi:sporulation protein YlmC with PRC-barrel domain
MSYSEISKKVRATIAHLEDGNDLGRLQNVLIDLENYKYESSALISKLTYTLLDKRKDVLKTIMNSSEPSMKKLLSSSTMTKLYIDMELGTEQLALDSMTDLVRNIRSSIETTRSLLSAAKAMANVI